MTEKLVLVTGACGEIGQALIQGLAKTPAPGASAGGGGGIEL